MSFFFRTPPNALPPRSEAQRAPLQGALTALVSLGLFGFRGLGFSLGLLGFRGLGFSLRLFGFRVLGMHASSKVRIRVYQGYQVHTVKFRLEVTR